jgi:hypothetical protein
MRQRLEEDRDIYVDNYKGTHVHDT